MKAGEWVVMCRGHRPEIGGDGLELARDEETLGGIAPPAVRMGKGVHQFAGARFEEPGEWGAFHPFPGDAVDPAPSDAFFVTGLEDLFAQIVVDVSLFLDDPMVHVDKVEASIRSGVEIDGTEVSIAGSDESCSRPFALRVIFEDVSV